jgi:hypothetical protein
LLQEQTTVPPIVQYSLSEMLEQTIGLYEELSGTASAGAAEAA